jgi:hypothetical protein
MEAWEAAMKGARDLPCPTCHRGELRFYAVGFRPPDERGGLSAVSVDLVELQHAPEWLDAHWDEIGGRSETGDG